MKEDLKQALTWIKNSFIYILLLIMVALAAFEAGMLVESKGLDDYSIGKAKLEIRELSGKVEAHEAVIRGLQKGRMPK